MPPALTRGPRVRLHRLHQLLLLLLPAAALAAAQPIWSRGGYSAVSVGPDFSLSLTVGVGGGDVLSFEAAPPAPAPATFAVANGGSDAQWGAFDELRLLSTSGALLYALRYYSNADAFSFSRPASPAASPWPWFALPAGANASAVGAWSFNWGYFLPGTFHASLDDCAASAAPVPAQAQVHSHAQAQAQAQAQATTPAPACNLTGWWCCDETRVVQGADGSLATSAAYGAGVGSIDGFVAHVNFSNVGPQTGAVSADCSAIDWTPVGSHWDRGAPPTQPHSDGPLFVFSRGASRPRAALVISPLDHFSSQNAACGAGGAPSAGSAFGIATSFAGAAAPPDARLSALLVARPGLKRSTVAAGALLRQRFQTVRRRGAGSRALSYWSDNAAGYSFWSASTNLSRWGVPETLFRQLYAGYKALAVPIVQWEIDSNFVTRHYGTFAGGWCWTSWREWNETFYPSGGKLSQLLGNASLALYVSAFCNDTVHKSEPGFQFLDVPGSPWSAAPVSVAHPSTAFAFYTSILKTARDEWGMQHFFTDFLCWREQKVALALPDLFDAGEAWLGGMTLAAQELGLETQFCMACGHQALLSLQWPGVTNVRANGDGGMDLGGLTTSSVLAAMVGLGWSKDNLRLRVFGAGDTELQTLLAALSLGPVGLSDELEGYPSPPAPDAGVVTNVSLAMSTCTSNGTLLQPSYPLTPVEDHMASEGGLGQRSGSVFATFTIVAGAGQSPWFTAVGFANGGSPPDGFALRPSHLAPLVDLTGSASNALNPPDFADVPTGAFLGAGTELQAPYYAWDPQSAGPALASWSEAAPFNLSLAQRSPQQVNLAPVFCAAGTGATPLALLGEQGKAAAVSSFRFASVTESCGSAVAASNLTVGLRGAPFERVTLLWSSAAHAWMAQTMPVTLGATGTATFTIPPLAALAPASRLR